MDFEKYIEKFILSSRWILAPIFIGLILVLVVLVVKFIFTFAYLLPEVSSMNFEIFAIEVLDLLDFALLGCLVLLVTYSGYENFISKINPARKESDRLTWMGRLGFSDLKLKIASTIIAISLIELLTDFLELETDLNPTYLSWKVIIQIVFIVSGLLLAYMEYIGERKK